METATAKELYFNNPNYLRVFATDLRDGRQGLNKEGGGEESMDMTPEEGVILAKALDGFRADIIEVGFPGNNGDYDFCAEMAGNINYATVAAFARDGIPGDIEAVFKALDAQIRQNRGQIALLTKTGERVRGKVTQQQIFDRMTAGVRQSIQGFQKRGVAPSIYTYFEGASEAPEGLLRELIAEHARVVQAETNPDLLSQVDLTYGICDTNGSAYPGKLERVMRALSPQVNGLGIPAILSVHPHNDRGFATGLAYEAVRGGARQVDVCFNGTGERHGNASTAEVLGNWHLNRLSDDADSKVREAVRDPDFPELETGVDLKRAYETANVAASTFRGEVPFKAPFVGKVGGNSKAGMHLSGEARDKYAFRTVNPQDFGVPESAEMQTSVMMGAAGVQRLLSPVGIYLPRKAAAKAFDQYSKSGGGHFTPYGFVDRFILTEDVLEQIDQHSDTYLQLESASWTGKSGKDGKLSSVSLEYKQGEEQATISEESSSGAIDATMRALRSITGQDMEIVWFTEHAIGDKGQDVGSDATVVTRLEVRWNGETRVAYSSDRQSVDAGIKALFHAVNAFSFWKKGEK